MASHAVALGAKFDTAAAQKHAHREIPVKHIWTDEPQQKATKRAAERHDVSLPARLTWKDQRGTPRFASVVTRNVSDYGVYVECPSLVSIPPFRLVQFQIEPDAREA